jgi:hypothetical protein
MQAGTNVPRRLESDTLVLSVVTTERKSMDTMSIEKMFGRIGARVKVFEEVSGFQRAGINIRTDKQGEYFDIRVEPGDTVEYEVIDSRPEMRHLLLMARRPNEKQKFLCGHDERHWFVCAVPGPSISNVTAAMEALQPPEVRSAVRRRVKRVKNRLRRRNKAFIRQGEWFFVPVPELTGNEKLIVKNEPTSRGNGSKSHMCQYVYRSGGETVYVGSHYPMGLSKDAYTKLLARKPAARAWSWRIMRRNAAVFVRGRVWHPDHKTVVLNDWHQVLMNTEGLAPGARSVVFLD